MVGLGSGQGKAVGCSCLISQTSGPSHLQVEAIFLIGREVRRPAGCAKPNGRLRWLMCWRCGIGHHHCPAFVCRYGESLQWPLRLF